MFKNIFVLSTFICILLSSISYSQGKTVDDFSKKTLPDWIWGGVEMKYSHPEDNKENGYAEISSKEIIKENAYIGKVFLKRPHLFSAGNYINIMLKGVDNDASVKIQLLYDVDNNTMFEEGEDIMLVSKPVSLNFNGWKEIKLKLDQENFEIISKFHDNFEVTEEEVLGIQLEFESNVKYKAGKFETGIALISEIQNKEVFTDGETSLSSNNKESYFGIRNYPNPFNPSTTITFNLPQSTSVVLTVYDRLGREVSVLVNQNLDAGEHTVDFNAGELLSGIYFYRIKTPEKTEVKKMLFTK